MASYIPRYPSDMSHWSCSKWAHYTVSPPFLSVLPCLVNHVTQVKIRGSYYCFFFHLQHQISHKIVCTSAIHTSRFCPSDPSPLFTWIMTTSSQLVSLSLSPIGPKHPSSHWYPRGFSKLQLQIPQSTICLFHGMSFT